MSDLPRYSRVLDEAALDTEPLTKGTRDSFDSHSQETPSAVYPPGNDVGSSSSVSEHHVTYIYISASLVAEHVLGVLGRDRQVRPH